jgi:hypothetical protein
MTRQLLLAMTLVRADHVRSFQIHPAYLAGWDASEHEDQRVVRQQRFTDWHRVERTLTRFRREIAALLEQGWQETLNGSVNG